jgi:hypothetical protein
MAAALVDLALLYLVSKTILRVVTPEKIQVSLPNNSVLADFFRYGEAVATVFFPVLVFVFLTAIFWLVTETLLGGLTPGRAVLGLTLSDETGGPLKRSKRVLRGMRKLSTLGLSGLQVSDLPKYDKAAGCVWNSSMAPVPRRRITEWVFVLQAKDGRKSRYRLGDISSFVRTGQLKIGRDAQWADIVLPSTSLASGRHCVVRVNRKQTEIIDNNSKNGTFIGNRKLAAGEWTVLPRKAVFRTTDVLCQILS